MVYFRFAVYTRLRGSVNAAGYRRNQRGGVRVSLHPLHHMADKAVYRVGNIPVLLGDQLQLMAHGRMADLKQMNIRKRKPLENGGGQHRDTVVQPHHLRGEVPAVGFNGYLRFKARLPAGEPHDLVRVVTAAAENEVLVFQLVKGDMILAGQRVLAADRQQKIVLYKPCMIELVLWNRSADAPQIQSAAVHGVQNVLTAGLRMPRTTAAIRPLASIRWFPAMSMPVSWRRWARMWCVFR